jgi:transcriptional regulator NrdR family protein
MKCPECTSLDYVVIRSEERKRTQTIYRRLRCNECFALWSTHVELGFPKIRVQRKKRRLTSREAALLILSTESIRVLAERYGISHQSVILIKQGKCYRDIHEIIQPLIERLEAND